MSINYWIGVCELAEFAPKVIALLDTHPVIYRIDKAIPDKLLRNEINKIKPKNIIFTFGFRISSNGDEAILDVQLTSFCSTLPYYYVPNANVITVESNKTKDLK